MKYIIGNWKSNKNTKEAKDFLQAYAQIIEDQSKDLADFTTIIAPPATLISPMQIKLQELGIPAQNQILLAAQDISAHGAGAFTGQLCADNFAGFGLNAVIIGHSERRIYARETHEEIALKISAALEAGLKPILCLDQSYIKEQAAMIDSELFSQLIIAFEPLSAIGTGQSMSPVSVSETIQEIKATYGDQTPIIYGGSVKPETVSDYLAICDGVLVGSASLDAQSFINLHQI